MPREPRQFGVEVNSFVWIGSLGAEHYYGKAWWRVNGKYETHKLEQPCSSKMAAYLNKKDEAWHARYKKGDLTERFDTEKEVVEAGIKFLTEKFGKRIKIEKGSISSCDNKIIYPKGVKKNAF